MLIGIDMGGTKIAGGLVHRGRIIKRVTLPTEASKGRKHIIGQLKAVIDELSEGQKVAGVGIGIPGTYQGTKVLELANVPELNGVDLKRALKLSVPIMVENDARCFLLGEHAWGAVKGARNAVGLIIGTGVGSAAIIEGSLYRGANGHAGEIGHIIFPEGDSWERTISGPAILRMHRKRGGKEERVSLIWESRSTLAAGTRKIVVKRIAAVVRNIILIYDPQAIVLGGGVSSLPLVDQVNEELARMGLRPILKQNMLGVESAILGAAAQF